MDLATLSNRLTDPTLVSSIREALLSWPEADPHLVEQTLTWVKGLRDELVSLCREIDDDEQIEQNLAITYIELKTRWIAINTRINYQLFRTGHNDPQSVFRATGVSMLLAHVESLLTAGDVAQITEFLAQPIRRAA
ncbi:MAG: hypothetical protein LW650_12885 [Planctomycetaceae bacterium]|jgi:hypothetical protein|nr:hypothetical protein [Phycisphaerales bacterium]MCE2654309.1 hypothetical protein [Planctomycetaceae bacterium]